ncbi:MAG: beta strand repeat-containing protein [Chlorobiota bacterium]
MKTILKLILLVVLTTTLSALEPMKVAFVYTAGTPTSVRVQMADNTSSSLFVGENLTSDITPNSSGIIIVNVQDHAGSGTTWSNYNASNITTYHTLDIYVNGTLYAQYRLDALILAQAQTSVFDNNGNFNPTQEGASLGTDGNRWSELFVEGNTVHIGPPLGMAGDELAFSYDDATNTATMTVAGLTALTSVNDNVNIPKQATIDGISVGKGNNSFSNNTAVGISALNSNTTGNHNTAVGSGALMSNENGNFNSAYGRSSLSSNTAGSNNTSVGYNTLLNNTTGIENTAVGGNALQSNTTAPYNSALGFNALRTNTTGTNNTGIGAYSLRNNTTGSGNTATGVNSLRDNTTGTNNTATGVNALVSNSTGTSNTAYGTNALTSNSTGSSNTAFGSFSFNNSTGDENTSIGSFAGFSLTTGSDNTFIGSQAGNNGSQKVDVQNSIAIGSGTHTTADNQVVIGDANITETQLRGVTLMDLAGSGTQNIQVDNTGKIITGGGGGTVSTNSTINGDGSGSSPLGINLANANVWTGNQTFRPTGLVGVIVDNSHLALVNTDNSARQIRFQEASGTGTNYVSFESTSSLAGNTNYKIPGDGSNGQVLTTDGSGNLSWTTPSGGGGGGATIQTQTTTALTPIPTTYTGAGVTFTLDANSSYLVRGDFQDVESGGTNGRFDVRFTYTGTFNHVHFSSFVSSVVLDESNLEDLRNAADNAGTTPSVIEGVITTTTGGTLTLQFRENVDSTNDVNINAGGTIVLIKM